MMESWIFWLCMAVGAFVGAGWGVRSAINKHRRDMEKMIAQLKERPKGGKP